MDLPPEKIEISDRLQLKRSLTLPLLVLYGLGVTIGAGIYVLVGATAAKAGIYAPMSFLLAACVVAFTGFSYSELGTRYPVSAGEAAYVKAGFNSQKLSLLIGLMVVASGVISAAAVTIGAAAYLQEFISINPKILTALIALLIGLIAIWGILESVIFAAVFTVIEICGLGLVIFYGFSTNPEAFNRLPTLIPPFDAAVWSGILSAGLLAFFAFVGFEDIANVAEEVKQPTKTIPKGIILTLVIAALIYFAVVAVVVLIVPMDELSGSAAPLALVFTQADIATSSSFHIIAIFATINGALIQVIMASRVLYGLGCQKSLPAIFANVNPFTRTPLFATVFVVCIILFLVYFLPIDQLAEATSRVVLIVFIFVNAALLKLKWQKQTADGDIFCVPTWVPFMGLITSGFLFLVGFFIA